MLFHILKFIWSDCDMLIVKNQCSTSTTEKIEQNCINTYIPNESGLKDFIIVFLLDDAGLKIKII